MWQEEKNLVWRKAKATSLAFEFLRFSLDQRVICVGCDKFDLDVYGAYCIGLASVGLRFKYSLLPLISQVKLVYGSTVRSLGENIRATLIRHDNCGSAPISGDRALISFVVVVE